MRDGLENGRDKGKVGWDRKWKDTRFPYDPMQYLVDGLHREVDELVVALKIEPTRVLREAADVANFAMMIADISNPNPFPEKEER